VQLVIASILIDWWRPNALDDLDDWRTPSRWRDTLHF
jgi:hypothetical protein